MPNTITYSCYEHVDRLDATHFTAAAADAAEQLAAHRHAIVDFCPGDATGYTIGVFHHPDRRDPYTVCLISPQGYSYPWRGQRLSYDYVTAKWTRDHEWTGAVLTRFLNALADEGDLS